jgi:hypothetical protein
MRRLLPTGDCSKRVNMPTPNTGDNPLREFDLKGIDRLLRIKPGPGRARGPVGTNIAGERDLASNGEEVAFGRYSLLAVGN